MSTRIGMLIIIFASTLVGAYTSVNSVTYSDEVAGVIFKYNAALENTIAEARIAANQPGVDKARLARKLNSRVTHLAQTTGERLCALGVSTETYVQSVAMPKNMVVTIKPLEVKGI